MGMGEEILVIKKDVLFKDNEFEGFLPLNEYNYIPLILNNYEYVVRTPQLEDDDSYQQPIPYVWLLNPKEKKVFLYKRSNTGNEGRLYDKYSGGVGGHIDKNTEQYSKNPVQDAMMRELREEVTMKNYPEPRVIGFLNFSNKGVEAVHFGIVAIGETEEEVIPAQDMANGRFYSVKDADEIISNSENNVEKWTLASWPFVREHLVKYF